MSRRLRKKPSMARKNPSRFRKNLSRLRKKPSAIRKSPSRCGVTFCKIERNQRGNKRKGGKDPERPERRQTVGFGGKGSDATGRPRSRWTFRPRPNRTNLLFRPPEVAMHSCSSWRFHDPAIVDSRGSSLPPLVAAALLLTVGYAPSPDGAVPGSLHIACWLPSPLCHFAGRTWTGEWEGDRSGIMMTPISGERTLRAAARLRPGPRRHHRDDRRRTAPRAACSADPRDVGSRRAARHSDRNAGAH